MSESSGSGSSGGTGRKRGGLFDDLAGVAGGAFSALAGVRNEAEAMARSQADQMIQRLDLVKREDLDAAMEVARRASDAVAALEARVVALEAHIAGSSQSAPEAGSAAAAETLPPADPAQEGTDDGA